MDVEYADDDLDRLEVELQISLPDFGREVVNGFRKAMQVI